MKYVHRNGNGDIIKVTNQPNGSVEVKEDNDPEVVAFLESLN